MRTLAITTSAAPRTDFTRKLFHIFLRANQQVSSYGSLDPRYPDDGAAAAD